GDDQGDAVADTETETQKLRDLRHGIEKHHQEQSPEAVALAWENLNHTDRNIAYASRIALEHQPLESWQDHFVKETDPTKIIQAGMALARQGDQKLEGTILDKLNTLKLEQLKQTQQVDLLRAYALVFIRMGMPNETLRKVTAKKLNAYFPHTNNRVTRELAQLLLYLKAEGANTALVDQLEKHTREKTQTEGVGLLSEEATLRSEQYGPLIREVLEKIPPSEAIYYGLLLSHAKENWAKKDWERYFQWFNEVFSAKGGMSFKAYMENVRQQALSHVPKDDRERLLEISGVYSPSTAVADLPQPRGPGKNYSAPEIRRILGGGQLKNYKGDIADGERAYKAAMCVICHRMRGEGGAAGPDLTQVHTKFSDYDLTFAIASPNDDITDQYAHTLFYLNDGNKVTGRILSEEGDSITVAPNPFNESHTLRVAKNTIEKRELSSVSPMPAGLLNRLNAQEILDLFAYLKSGGDENHAMYGGKTENP
ncbi:MAG: c-type cytochrome, partial [Bacteroidota bacterium]